jgi:hypothetical protein
LEGGAAGVLDDDREGAVRHVHGKADRRAGRGLERVRDPLLGDVEGSPSAVGRKMPWVSPPTAWLTA